MILLFLGSWRSTLIVVVSIPLSILVSIIVLGVARADAQRHDARRAWRSRSASWSTTPRSRSRTSTATSAQQKPIVRAILDGAQRDRDARVRLDALHLHRLRAGRLHHRRGEVALRAAGDGGRLRDADVVLPLAHARADDGALPARRRRRRTTRRAITRRRRRSRGASSRRSSAASSGCAMVYGGWLALGARAPRGSSSPASSRSSPARSRSSRSSGATSSRASTPGSSSCTCAAPPGTRIEETERRFAQIEDTIRTRHPAERDRDDARQHRHPVQRHQPVAQRGRAHLVGRRRDPHRAQGGPRADGRATCASCARRSTQTFPEQTFFFLAPDISTQVLNFGLAAPIDVQVVGADRQRGRRRYARRAADRRRGSKRSPARSTCTSRRCSTQPELRIDVDRTMAGQLGLTQRDVASDLLVSLVVERAGGAELLARQARRPVPRRGADAAVRRSTRSTRCDTTPISTGGDAAAAPRRTSRRVSRTDGPGEHHPLQRRAHLRRAGQRRRHRPRLASPTRVAEGRRRAQAVDCRAGTTVRIKGQVESMDVVVPRPRLRARLRRACSSTC